MRLSEGEKDPETVECLEAMGGCVKPGVSGVPPLAIHCPARGDGLPLHCSYLAQEQLRRRRRKVSKFTIIIIMRMKAKMSPNLNLSCCHS